MPSRFRVATTLPRRLEELGVLPADVLRQAGLPAGLFGQDKILVSTEELFALGGFAQASRDPAIGLRLGTDRVDEWMERVSDEEYAAASRLQSQEEETCRSASWVAAARRCRHSVSAAWG